MANRFNHVVRVGVLLLLTQSAHAAVIMFSPGLAYERSGHTQTLLLETSPQDLSNRYVADTECYESLVTQLFLGNDVYEQQHVSMRAGLTLGFVDNSRMNGVVQQFALADFDNFSYQYDVQSLTAMATLRIHAIVHQRLQPYVDGSIGLASNHAFNYSETLRIDGAVPMSPYADHRANRFAYSVGVGAMYNINTKLSLGLGYQFTDLGRTELGLSAAQQTTQTLTVKDLLLQQLLFNISVTL